MDPDRMKAMTDGVLAIVLTILVLSFEVPEHDFERDGLLKFLEGQFEPFVAYVVSFAIVAAYWVQHAAIFHYVRVADRGLFWLNLLFLLPVSLLPFLTDLRATYHDVHVVTVLYAAANVASCLLLFALWRRVAGQSVPPEVDRSMTRRILLGVGLNVVGAAAAWIDTHLSSAFFVALPVLYLSHRIVDARWKTPGASDRTEASR
jgi:uncharacterized membrane protein